MSSENTSQTDPKALVQHVAKLARLSLTEDEAERYGKDMSNIFAMVNQLSELNFDEEIDPASLEQAQPTVFRDDVVKPRPDFEVMLKNAPLREGDFFRVPKITDN